MTKIKIFFFGFKAFCVAVGALFIGWLSYSWRTEKTVKTADKITTENDNSQEVKNELLQSRDDLVNLP